MKEFLLRYLCCCFQTSVASDSIFDREPKGDEVIEVPERGKRGWKLEKSDIGVKGSETNAPCGRFLAYSPFSLVYMQPRKLRIGGYKDYPPQVTFEDCKDWSLKRCNHPGSDAELLQIVLKLANIDYELVHQNIDDTDEILGLIENGSLDMSIMALRMIEKRYDHVLFTTPINFLKYGYLVKEVEKLESDDFLLHTFRPEIYLLIIASLLVTALAIRFICHSDSAFHTWCWRLFILFFNQDHFFFRPKVTTIFIGGGWIVFGFLMVTYYQSKMKGFLAVPLHRSIPFNTMSGMLDAMENDGFTAFKVKGGYDPLYYCRPNECERVERLRKAGRLVYYSKQERYNQRFILNNVHDKRITFIGLTTYQSLYDVSIYNLEKRILFVGDVGVHQELLAFIMNRRFKEEREAINRALLITQNAYGRIRKRYNSALRPFRQSTNNLSSSRITISIIHLLNFFIMYAGLSVLAVTVFVLELLSYKHQWHNFTLPRQAS